MVEARKRGRPRSEPARRAILDAALAELEDRGYAALTIEGIAARAGVGKQTIYRWWPSKADGVLDALLDLAREPGPTETAPAGTARGCAGRCSEGGRPPAVLADVVPCAGHVVDGDRARRKAGQQLLHRLRFGVAVVERVGQIAEGRVVPDQH